jgi:hypothetical protein
MSEIVSSNTLFHFIKSIDNLKGILSEGFRISYVPEKIAERDSKNKGYYIAPMAIPEA